MTEATEQHASTKPSGVNPPVLTERPGKAPLFSAEAAMSRTSWHRAGWLELVAEGAFRLAFTEEFAAPRLRPHERASTVIKRAEKRVQKWLDANHSPKSTAA